MKIVLEENDSFIQPDGVAKMIVVAVTKDDGKIVRFPYDANRSMSELIQDVTVKLSDAPKSQERVIDTAPLHQAKQQQMYDIVSKTLADTTGKIQKEDIVRCIKVHDRGKGATVDLQVEGIYRVLKLNMNGPYVASYDIIDDTDYHKADIPRRILAFPDEIQFVEKRKPPIPKEIGRIEEIFVCPDCMKATTCYKMDDDRFHGRCECGKEVISVTVRPKGAWGGT